MEGTFQSGIQLIDFTRFFLLSYMLFIEAKSLQFGPWQSTIIFLALIQSFQCSFDRPDGSGPLQSSWKCIESAGLHSFGHIGSECEVQKNIPVFNHIERISTYTSIFSHVYVNIGSPAEPIDIRWNDCQSPYLDHAHDPFVPRQQSAKATDKRGKERSGASELWVDDDEPTSSNTTSVRLTMLELKVATPAKVIQALEFHRIPPEISVMRINMDNYNCDIGREILLRGFRPIVFIAQFNPIFPPPIRFNVAFGRANSDAETEDKISLALQYSGLIQCSISHLADIVESQDFLPIGVDGYEVTFIRSRWARTLYPTLSMDVFSMWTQENQDKNWIVTHCSWTSELCEMGRVQTWIHLAKTGSFGLLQEQVMKYAEQYGLGSRIELSEYPLLFPSESNVTDHVGCSKLIQPSMIDPTVVQRVQ